MPLDEFQELKGGQHKKGKFRIVFFLVFLIVIGVMIYELSKGIDKFQTTLKARQAAIEGLIYTD